MKRIFALIVLTAIVFSATACTRVNYACSPERSDTLAKNVSLIEEESSFSDFEIDGSTVNFSCELTFKNTSDSKVTFYLVGDFKPEYESGLIKERYLRGVNFEDKNEKLTLKAKERKTYTFVFKGNHGSGNQKPNRQLPEIEAYEII